MPLSGDKVAVYNVQMENSTYYYYILFYWVNKIKIEFSFSNNSTAKLYIVCKKSFIIKGKVIHRVATYKCNQVLTDGRTNKWTDGQTYKQRIF